MRKSYILLVITTIFFLACNSNPEPATATPPPRLTDEPKKFGRIQLSYEDTTSPEYKAIVRRLDSFYRIQVAKGFNGSVLIGYKGKILFERYFGYANKGTKQKLTPYSSVQLASISKTFTAAAILYLYEKKYLDIDDKVKTYLPSFPYDKITVRMLLNHRAGLPDYLKWYGRYRKDTKTPVYNEDIIKLFANFKPGLDFTPDTRFKYSNSNYVVLASIIEEVTEMRYKDFMKQYIFEPLGMDHTFVYDPAEGLPASATVSYRYNWVPYPDMFADGVYGDKGIYSTVEDMYRWDQSFYRGTLLNNETIELAYGPCSFEKPGIRNYGLGWRMLCYADGDKIIYHNGWWHGNNTVFFRFIQDNFTILVLGNKYNNSIYRQKDAIYKIVKGTEEDFGDEGEE